MSTALTTIEQNGTVSVLAPLTARDIRAQVNLIQEVMREVMRDGEHYGKVPGCGDKPTLLQPGAQKLVMTFRLVPDVESTIVPMERGHREVRSKIRIYERGKNGEERGALLGVGVGTCSTMEGKYRFRTGPVEFTEKPVPREYWDLRDTDPKKAKDLLGGAGYVAKKNEEGRWVCARQGEKVEHDNPADYYNTVEKISFKRAMVSATLNVTAASDIFTQDIEDMPEVIPGAQSASAATATQPQTEPAHAGHGKAASVLNKMKPADHGKGDGADVPPQSDSRPQQGSDAPSPQQLAERMEMAESVAELSGVMNLATKTEMSAEDRATLKTLFDTHLARLKPGKK